MTMRGIRVHRRMVFVYYLYIHCFLFISNFRRGSTCCHSPNRRVRLCSGVERRVALLGSWRGEWRRRW